MIASTLIFITFFATASLAQVGWQQQQSDIFNDLFYVQFTSRDTGYVSGIDYDGYGFLYRTTDQGNTWLTFGPPGAGDSFFFLNDRTAWISNPKGSGIFFTNDYGQTWVTRGTFAGASVAKMHFADTNSGFAVNGTGNVVFRTVDGGKTWIANKVLGVGQFYDIVAFGGKEFLAVGEQYAANNPRGCAALAHNSADTVARIPNMCIASSLLHVDALDTVMAVCIGADGRDNYRPKFYKTKNRGLLWTGGYFPSHKVTSFDFSNERNGTTVGIEGTIYRTTDGGGKWVLQTSPVTDVELTDVFFTDSLNGTAVGLRGTILHTSDAGKSWVRQYLPKKINVTSYPEPFTKTTMIHYSTEIPGRVTIRIYDALGKELEVFQGSGAQTIEFDGSKYPDGKFYYRIEGDGVSGVGTLTKVAF